jgi:hypothetical protein
VRRSSHLLPGLGRDGHAAGQFVAFGGTVHEPPLVVEAVVSGAGIRRPLEADPSVQSLGVDALQGHLVGNRPLDLGAALAIVRVNVPVSPLERVLRRNLQRVQPLGVLNNGSIGGSQKKTGMSQAVSLPPAFGSVAGSVRTSAIKARCRATATGAPTSV